jgi:histidine phosphotransferase ChpT
MTDMLAAAETPTPVKPAELAAYLAARLCHDFISPASAIVSGVDLLEDPTAQDMREEAMGLVASSARKLADLLSFSRVAFGASASAQNFDARDLETLARGVFAHMRAELVWDSSVAEVNKPAARTLLNLTQMAGAALPTGGTATVRLTESQDALDIAIEAQGPRARLRPEVLAGLRGEGPGEGMHGHWVQARYVSLLVGDAGGTVSGEVGEECVVLAAKIPRG